MTRHLHISPMMTCWRWMTSRCHQHSRSHHRPQIYGKNSPSERWPQRNRSPCYGRRKNANKLSYSSSGRGHNSKEPCALPQSTKSHGDRATWRDAALLHEDLEWRVAIASRPTLGLYNHMTITRLPIWLTWLTIGFDLEFSKRRYLSKRCVMVVHMALYLMNDTRGLPQSIEHKLSICTFR